MVEWDSVEMVPRRIAIYRFVVNGLYPFLNANGYSLYQTPREFATSIGTLLYLNRGASCLDSHPAVLDDAAKEYMEERQHFYHVLDWRKWQEFWNVWGVWEDVSLEDSRGADRRIDIQEFCWSHIDIEYSRQSTVVKELMGLVDETSTGRGEDSYLREAAESNEWGGYRK